MDLLRTAEQYRKGALEVLDAENQASRGQYFTPLLAAQIIANLPRLPEEGTFRILDPGAGSGILSAAIAERIRREAPQLRFSIVAVENDEVLFPTLQETLNDIERCTNASTELVPAEFLSWALHHDESFDLVIQNPPYTKLSSSSEDQKNVAAKWHSGAEQLRCVYGTRATASLKGGQQVSITPRSWMNGAYYSIFRRQFAAIAGIDSIHTFESRSKVFRDTGVLQEAIIVSATKGESPKNVKVFTSRDHTSTPTQRTVAYEDVVTPDFVHVPATQEDAKAVAWMTKNVHCALKDLSLTVSTGRVVDFRSRGNLKIEPEIGAVPLLHATHLRGGRVHHPICLKKPEWFVPDSKKTQKMLVEGGEHMFSLSVSPQGRSVAEW